MKILTVTGVLALILLVIGVLAESQNWDDEKTFWTKNSIRNFEKRIKKLEARMSRAERPRRQVRDAEDGIPPIRPRRPLTLAQMQERIEEVDSKVKIHILIHPHSIELVGAPEGTLFQVGPGWDDFLKDEDGQEETHEEANQ